MRRTQIFNVMLMLAVLWVLSLVLLQHRVPVPAAPPGARTEGAAGAAGAVHAEVSSPSAPAADAASVDAAASMQIMCERVAIELPGAGAGAGIGLGAAAKGFLCVVGDAGVDEGNFTIYNGNTCTLPASSTHESRR